MVLSVVAGKAKQQCLEIFILRASEPRIMWLAIRDGIDYAAAGAGGCVTVVMRKLRVCSVCMRSQF